MNDACLGLSRCLIPKPCDSELLFNPCDTSRSSESRSAPSRTVNALALFTPNDGSSPMGLPFVPPLAAFEYGGV